MQHWIKKHNFIGNFFFFVKNYLEIMKKSRRIYRQYNRK